MRLLGVQAAALILLSAQQIEATAGHRHHHMHAGKRHAHTHGPRSMKEGDVEKRTPECKLPNDPDLVFIPGAQNGGFAMSPDQPCKAGDYCPIACKPGKVMAQWQPGSTYTYPESMNGGLYCDENGQAKKPFPDAPYCVDGTGTVSVINKCGKPLSYCQTVLPGNEAMLIPTVIDGEATIAVPGPSYWASTSAHYYVNPPGVGSEGCIWGDSSKPIGNWAPYIAGANTDSTGNTYVTLGNNPINEHEGKGLESQARNYGLRIECPNGGCNGLPCEIAPSNGVGGITSNLQAVGAGGSSFCVVTVSPGHHANIVVYPADGNEVEPSSSSAKSDEEEETKSPTTSASGPSSTSGEDDEASTAAGASSSMRARPTHRPGIFHENSTSTDDDDLTSSGRTTLAPSTIPTSAEASPTESTPNEGVSRQQGSAAVASLIVALVAATCFY